MRAIVLCAGEGTRLRPLTHTQPKAMLPVANRPVLHWICATLARAGLHEVGVVISPDQADLPQRLGNGRDLGVSLRYLFQTGPRGIAGALLAAREFVAGEPFLVYLGDNLTGAPLQPLIVRFAASGAGALLALRQVADPRAFGVAVVEGERVAAVEEKPAQPRSNLAIIGIYLFRPEIMSAIARIKPSARGELEITDAIALMIQTGGEVLWHPAGSWWCDMGSVDGWLEANREVLSRMPAETAPGAVVRESRLEGMVRVGPGAVIERSVVRGPAVIGAGCLLQDAHIGPCTAVGEGARVRLATIENSILLENAVIEQVPFRLSDCILGREVVVGGGGGSDLTAHLVVGDYGRLTLPKP